MRSTGFESYENFVTNTFNIYQKNYNYGVYHIGGNNPNLEVNQYAYILLNDNNFRGHIWLDKYDLKKINTNHKFNLKEYISYEECEKYDTHVDATEEDINYIITELEKMKKFKELEKRPWYDLNKWVEWYNNL